MILTLMLIILTATLVIVIIGFVMDRIAITQLKSGMRTINKRVKRIEKEICPDPWIIEGPNGEQLRKVCESLEKMEAEGGLYEVVDSETDTETETADGGDISAETNDEVQTTGD